MAFTVAGFKYVTENNVRNEIDLLRNMTEWEV